MTSALACQRAIDHGLELSDAVGRSVSSAYGLPLVEQDQGRQRSHLVCGGNGRGVLVVDPDQLERAGATLLELLQHRAQRFARTTPRSMKLHQNWNRGLGHFGRKGSVVGLDHAIQRTTEAW